MLAKFKNTFLIILLCLINVHSYAENKLPDTLYAKVIRIVDGDTIHLEHNKFGKIKVRLAEIDTPASAFLLFKFIHITSPKHQ